MIRKIYLMIDNTKIKEQGSFSVSDELHLSYKWDKDVEKYMLTC